MASAVRKCAEADRAMAAALADLAAVLLPCHFSTQRVLEKLRLVKMPSLAACNQGGIWRQLLCWFK